MVANGCHNPAIEVDLLRLLLTHDATAKRLAFQVCELLMGPIEFVIGAVRALEMIDPPPSTLLIAEWASKLGQSLFYPPNVFGWQGGRSWLSSRVLINRVNFAAAFVAGQAHNPPRPFNDKAFASKHGYDGDPPHLVSELILGCAEIEFESVAAILASPQAQSG